MAKLTGIKEQHEENLTLLEGELATTQQTLTKTEHDVAQLMDVKTQHEDKIARLEAQLVQTKEELTKMQDEYDETKRSLQEQLATSKSEVEGLLDLKAQHEQRICSLEDQLAVKKNELLLLKEKLADTTDTLQAQLQASKDEAAQLADLKEKQEQRIAELEAELDSTHEELTQTRAQLERTIADLKVKLDEKTEANSQQEQALAEAAGVNAECNTKIADLEDRLADMLSQLECSRLERQHLQDTLFATSEQLQADLLQVGHDMQTMQQNAIEKMQVALKQQEADKQLKLQQAADELARVQESLSHTQQELEDRQTALQAAAQLEQELRQSLEHSNGMLQQERADSEALRRDLAEVDQNLSEAHASCADKEQNLARLAAQLQDSEASLQQEREQRQEDGASAAKAAQAAMQELCDTQNAHSAAMHEMEMAHASAIAAMQDEHASAMQEWRQQLQDAQEQHAAAMTAATTEHEHLLVKLSSEAAADKQRLQELAESTKTELSEKLQQAEKDFAFINQSLDEARAEHQQAADKAKVAIDEANLQLAVATSKIDMLEKALKGTEQDRAKALTTISSMYEQTDKQLKALATGACNVVADAGALARMATLQAELESSMMERSECLQQLHALQKSEREAAAEALKHRQALENVQTEKKALADRIAVLEVDNAKLSAENVQLVGHSNLKQRINIFNNVKDENNTLKKEKTDAERLIAQQKKVIERMQMASGADKENACLFAKIDHEERLQSALNQSENEIRSLRKHLLTLVHHVQTSLGQTPLAASLEVTPCNQSEVPQALCDSSNKGFKQRDWCHDVKETERIIDALTTHIQQQSREVAGANLKISLLEQSVRILQPTAGGEVCT